MKTKKILSLILCVAFICMAFAPTALARYEGCSYCGARMVEIDESSPYGHTYKFVTCLKFPNRQDVLHTYKIDHLFQCSNPNCGLEYYVDTETISERICGH